MRESRQSNFDEYSKQLQRIEKQLFGEELPSPPSVVPVVTEEKPELDTEDKDPPLIASSIW